ncbi:hypothetical protein C8J57DRAFT_1392379 [Mycena rebaudengoi]|nr:hypothetical protein C8J57DRAFT_1392379 [Mycena rebaudengoi]
MGLYYLNMIQTACLLNLSMPLVLCLCPRLCLPRCLFVRCACRCLISLWCLPRLPHPGKILASCPPSTIATWTSTHLVKPLHRERRRKPALWLLTCRCFSAFCASHKL